ncbi:GNAT family N-acetyltransferase [Novosphingobium sp. MMS21-SN21R]|uniref:GNAT family N-acetyltransferase n=1 Tax=Novosphingobium sp. MMS21-SN21R TaxID=2969298 RepID=UPI002887D861|nr:GNAT family N-acetyltransferase [Novosphingobium sp. MMS21-SN21R]MDT0508957.1 GNAT family N-acetyltransferase [Novosphingobium sp. MMS21-SN21R]
MTVRLWPATPEHFANLLAAADPAEGITQADTPIADDDVLAMLAGLAATIASQFTPPAWLIIDEGRLVGLLSITALSEGVTLQIGYGVAMGERGKGYAAAAVARLLDWARGDARVSAMYAETRTDNIASQHVLERNAFVRIGERVDEEDGDLFCWRIDC